MHKCFTFGVIGSVFMANNWRNSCILEETELHARQESRINQHPGYRVVNRHSTEPCTFWWARYHRVGSYITPAVYGFSITIQEPISIYDTGGPKLVITVPTCKFQMAEHLTALGFNADANVLITCFLQDYLVINDFIQSVSTWHPSKWTTWSSQILWHEECVQQYHLVVCDFTDHIPSTRKYKFSYCCKFSPHIHTWKLRGSANANQFQSTFKIKAMTAAATVVPTAGTGTDSANCDESAWSKLMGPLLDVANEVCSVSKNH